MRQLQRGRSLALVVGCTQGKTLAASSDLLLRSLEASPDRCQLWAVRVRTARPTAALRDLYKGQQWRSTLTLEQHASKRHAAVQLWVVSAGVGLRRAEDHAPGYSASFTSGPDAVGADLRERRAWWSMLQTQDGTRGLAGVREAVDEMLVVLSPSYLAVVRPDLEDVEDDGVAVVTSGQVSHPRGVSSAGLQPELGGSDQTLNQRAAARLLDLAAARPIGCARVRAEWAAWTAPRRAARRHARTPLDDDALRELIRRHATTGPRSASRLLAEVRRDGFACEQSRFHRLYAETMTGAA